MHSTASSKCELRFGQTILYWTPSMPPRFSPKHIRWTIRLIAASLLILCGWLGWKHWLKPWLFPPSPLIITPQVALGNLEAKTLYFNGPAYPWLKKFRPELLTDTTEDRVRTFSQGTQNPKLFRQLDRQVRFDTILLLDDPSNYQRLLDHLLEPELAQRDFRVVYLDHWGIVFKRGAAREWEPSDAESLKQKFAGLTSEDRATFLAKTAERMLAVRKLEPAKKWLDEAMELDSSSLDALNGMASYYVAQGKWVEAESYADKALEKNENSIAALQAKVVTLRATNHKNDAYKLSGKLNALLPESPVRLWQHAQLAHEAEHYPEEITDLTRLIEMAKAEERPTGQYEFYLGEAHVFEARKDDSHAAIAAEHLKKALADPGLSKEERRFAEERLKTIREKTGIK